MPTIVVINRPGLDWLVNNPAGPVGRHLARKGMKVTALAKAKVGVRTGALRASIHMRHSRDSRGQFIRIGSDLRYARMHHEGTKPHLIIPQRAQTLRFVRGSGVVFAHSVRHPGTKPNRYLSDSLRRIT